MKKVLFSIFTAFCLMAAPLSAFEWGGVFSNNSGVNAPEITIKQSDGISLWFNTPLGENSGFTLSGETLYKFNLTIVKDTDPEFVQIFDVPLLKVAGNINTGAGLLSLNVGRFYYVDSTSAVLAQTVDGITVGYSLPAVKLGFFAGYTGLLNSLNAPMAIASEKTNNIYRLAYPYVPVGASVEVPFASNQSFELSAYYLLDCGANKTNLFYGNFVLSGPITNSIYYNLASSWGLIKFKDLMNYSALSIMMFPTQEISLNAGVTFGSAAEQGGFTAFVSPAPVSLTAAGAITPKLGFTFTKDSFCVDVNGNFVLAYNDSKYKGATSDVSAAFIYNIFSDLQVGLTVNATLDVSGGNAHTYGANLNVALAF